MTEKLDHAFVGRGETSAGDYCYYYRHFVIEGTPPAAHGRYCGRPRSEHPEPEPQALSDEARSSYSVVEEPGEWVVYRAGDPDWFLRYDTRDEAEMYWGEFTEAERRGREEGRKEEARSSEQLRAAMDAILKHCDVDSDGETDFERAIIAARNQPWLDSTWAWGRPWRDYARAEYGRGRKERDKEIVAALRRDHARIMRDLAAVRSQCAADKLHAGATVLAHWADAVERGGKL